MNRSVRVLAPLLVLAATACGSGGGRPVPVPSRVPRPPSGSPAPPLSGQPSSAPAAPPASSSPTPAPSPPASASATSAPPVTGARWHPAPGTAWQWQLSGTVDQSVDVPVYDIDGFENDAGVVAALHAKGRKVICYVNAGGWEDFRPDAAAYPKPLLGASDGWSGERWLDIRQLDVLRPLVAARFDMCRAKGFDAVEPDLLEAYANRSGFPLTAADQLAFNRMVADLAHRRGLSVALKNDVDQVPDLVDDFDFSIDEQCAEYQECDGLTPFVKAGKAVLHVEYGVAAADFCPESARLGFSSMAKHQNLDAWRQPC